MYTIYKSGCDDTAFVCYVFLDFRVVGWLLCSPSHFEAALLMALRSIPIQRHYKFTAVSTDLHVVLQPLLRAFYVSYLRSLASIFVTLAFLFFHQCLPYCLTSAHRTLNLFTWRNPPPVPIPRTSPSALALSAHSSFAV